MSVSTAGERLIFHNAKQILMANGIDPTRTINTQSYLRLEVLASISQNIFTFQVIQGSNQFATENRLVLQDSFLVSSAAAFWYIPTASGTPGPSNAPLLSWPNPNLFTVANSAAQAESLYNGFLTLSVNKKVVVPSWDLYRSRLVNQTQLTAAANSPVDQLSGRDDCFYPTEPNWLVIGSRNSVFTITMPNAFTAVMTNSRIVLYLRGLLIQDSTSVQ